jgi:uncharacterized protein YbjT (DUF2867 family)
MSTVLITGAAGFLGSRLLANSAARPRAIRAMTRRRPFPDPSRNDVHWVHGDVTSGEGLDEAAQGADIIIHAASDPRQRSGQTDVEGTRRLLDSATRNSVKHFVYISIVGIDEVPLRYYRHKLAAEQLVRASGVPFTIVRGTQFHEFMASQCAAFSRLPIAMAPRDFRVQPIDVDEFATAAWRSANGQPSLSIVNAAGPEVLTYDALLRAWLTAKNSRKPVISVPVPGRIGAALRRGDLTAPGHRVGTVTWTQWLSRARRVDAHMV